MRPFPREVAAHTVPLGQPMNPQALGEPPVVVLSAVAGDADTVGAVRLARVSRYGEQVVGDRGP